MENRKYEILLLLKPNLESSVFKKLETEIEKKIGGKVIKKENWGLRVLAYKIEKQNEAHYLLYYVETTPDNIASFKNFIALEKDILRPMILKHDKFWPFDYKKTSKDLTFPERKRTSKYPPRDNKAPREYKKKNDK